MAQSAITVTPPNPTPPTNLSYVGATPPLDPLQPQADDGYTPGTNYPAGTAFAAKTAAAGSGTSVDAEGKGTEVVVNATYNPAVFVPTGAAVTTFSCLGNFTGVANSPNATHASSLSPATNPTLTSINPTTAVHAASGTVALTATTVGATRQSVICVNGVPVPTTYGSPTSLTANIPKINSAGTQTVTVVTGGVVTTAGQTFTWT